MPPKVELIYGSILVAIALIAMIYLASAGFGGAKAFLLPLLPFVFGANAIHVGMKGLRDQKSDD